MNRTYFKTGIILMWLALPLTALRYWRVWDELPARMATHFNAAGQPNGWMSRETSLGFALGLTIFLLTLFSIVLYVAQRKSADGRSAWALLGFFYLVLFVVYKVNASVVDHALYGTPVEVGWVLVTIPVGVIGLMIVFIGSHRGTAFPLDSSEVIAEETHAGRAWAPLFILPAIPVLGAFVCIPNRTLRFAMLLIFVILAITFGMAWDGFRYRFSKSGLEIFTIGFRLRSIPLSQIREYAVSPWNAIGGYGIRGLGESRAYVWGSKGVRIKTTAGEVFLGHNEPQRIVQDLDTIKQFAHS